MKRYILLLIALVTMGLSAQNVNQEQARQTAMKFLKEAGVQSKLASQPAKAPAAKGATAESPLYYVFNAEDGKAHAIVSAIHNEVIGYSPTNALDAENMPENMKWYVETLAEVGMPHKASSHAEISPLISTVWHQRFPFNDHLPSDAKGNLSAAGCGAIAMAQIMNYYAYPAQSGRISGYKVEDKENEKTKYIDIDISEEPEKDEISNPQRHRHLESIYFKWGEYKDNYEGYTKEKNPSECNAIAQLINYVGKACKMYYTLNESTSYIDDRCDAYGKQFGYNGEIVNQRFTIDGKSIDIRHYAVWDQLIYSELKNHRPVEMSGATANGVGHAWVCDGYRNGLYHMNWGWGPKDLSYVGLLSLDAPNGMAFNADIYAIIGIVPANLVNLSNVGNEEITIKEGQSLKLNFSTGNGFAKDLPAEAFVWISMPEDEEFIALNNGKIYAKKATNKNIIVGAYGAGGKIKLYYNINVIKNDDPSTQQCVVDEIMTTVNKANDAAANGATKEQLQAIEDELNNVKLNYQNQGNNEEETPDVTYSGAYEYVDLGLPSGNKWATKNIGAAAPEDAGYYFAWGEECTKVSYTPESSYTYQVNSDALIATGIAKEKDGRMQFTSTYDAAAQIWRGNWVAPTLSDMEELTTKCDWYWETLNGERGYRVIGPNGQSIFLPTGGRKNLSAVVQTDDGCYWLNDAPLDQPTTASALFFNASQTLLNPQARFHGFNMRAIIKGKEDVDPTPAGEHEYVDLGLSVKWATCNVGASSPEDYGDYFAWGETEPKDYYDWSTYKWCNGSRDSMTKYCTESDYGQVDNKTTLDPEDDAAHVNWGGAWRMPTMEEMDELREKCTWTFCSWTFTTQNSINGYEVVGPNGNSIFLPAAGIYSQQYLTYDNGLWGCYSSSSLHPSYDTYSYSIFFNPTTLFLNFNREAGCSVRPVCP